MPDKTPRDSPWDHPTDCPCNREYPTTPTQSPDEHQRLEDWFNANFISGDKDTDELTIKFSGWQELKHIIARTNRESRIDELKKVAQAGNAFAKKWGSIEAGYAHIRDQIQDRIAALESQTNNGEDHE
jgi:hypothetical protein